MSQVSMKDGKEVDQFTGNIVVFKIYLNDQNVVATNIDLTNNKDASFTHFKAEEEVLLLPLFTFQVTEVYQSSGQKTVKYKDNNN